MENALPPPPPGIMFVDSMESNNNSFKTMDPEAFATLMLNNYKAGDPKTYCEIVVGQVSSASSKPYARRITKCKPYADIDAMFPMDKTPSKEEIESLKFKWLKLWADALSPHLGLELDIEDIKVASRHRVLAFSKKSKTQDATISPKFKVSFRFFLPGVKTEPYVIKDIMKNAGLFAEDSNFDNQVYRSNGKMSACFAKKDKYTTAVLLPEENIAACDPLDYVITHTEPDWRELVFNAPPPPPRPPRSASAASTPDRAVIAETTTSEDADEPDIYDPDFVKVKPVLQHMGFKDIQIKTCVPLDERAGKFITFDCDNRDCCPCCKSDHTTNNWSLTITKKANVTVKNFSQRCQVVDVFASRPVDSFCAKIIKNKKMAARHKDYAERFARMGVDYLCPNIKEDKYYVFDGAKWAITDSVHQKMSTELQKLVDDERAIISEVYLPAASAFNLSMDAKVLSDGMDGLDQAHINIGVNGFMASVEKELRNVCAFRGLFDDIYTNFHCNDVTIDLSSIITGDEDPIIRKATPEDLNSFTSGYNYYDYKGEEEDEQVARFYEQIFPDVNERIYFKRFAGLCISGVCDAKAFCSLSDMRAGNNGKSACVSLMKMTMGDYAAVPPKDMLYTTGKVDARSASPYLNALIGKRFIAFEELDPTKRFNTSLIKEWTGGYNVPVSTRGLYQGQIEFKSQMKILMAFNGEFVQSL